MKNYLALSALASQAAKLSDIHEVIDLVSMVMNNDASLAALFFQQGVWDNLSFARRVERVSGYIDLCASEFAARDNGALVEVGVAEAA